jgi:hypothetical protein
MIIGGKDNMKKRFLKKNNDAQVLGLPMHLIIIMIVAVAIIAAVLMMIPRGTKMMIGQVQSGGVFKGDGSAGEISVTNVVITVEVKTNDDRRDPIQGALVRLSGARGIGEATTNHQGIAVVNVGECILNHGVNEAYLKMTIKAEGYEDYEDQRAVLIYRG